MSQRLGQSGGDLNRPLEEVEAGLEKLSLLANQELSRGEYYQRWLMESVSLAGASGGTVWNARQQRFELLAQCQTPIEQLATSEQFRRQHTSRLSQLIRTGTTAQVELEGATDPAGKATRQTLFMAPILVAGQTTAVAELWYPAPTKVNDDQQQMLVAACEIATDFEAAWDRRAWSGEASFWQQLAELVSRLPQSSSAEVTEQTIASTARSLIPCSRATLVRILPSGSARAAAVSDVAWFERRSERIRSLEELARLVAHNRQAIWYGADLPPVAEELQGLFQICLEQSHARRLGAIPLITADSEQAIEAAAVAVVIVEFEGQETRSEAMPRAQRMADLCARPLAAAYDTSGLPLLGLSRWIRDLFFVPLRSRWAKLALVSLLVLLVPLALLLITVELEIEARGQLLPSVRQHVYAPLDGVITKVAVSHGEEVRQGAELLVMHSQSLDQEQTRLRGELDSTQERIRVLNSARSLNVAQAGPEQRVELIRMSAELVQLAAVVTSYQQQLELVTRQQQQLTVLSPVEGQVLTWQVAEELQTRPVSRGQKLVTIADTKGPWEVALDVPAEEIAYLREASSRHKVPLAVSFVLETNPGQEFQGEIRQMGQSVRRSDSEQLTVPVTVSLSGQMPDQPRAGAGIRGRVACGRRPIGFVWFRQIIRYFQLHWF